MHNEPYQLIKFTPLSLKDKIPFDEYELHDRNFTIIKRNANLNFIPFHNTVV